MPSLPISLHISSLTALCASSITHSISSGVTLHTPSSRLDLVSAITDKYVVTDIRQCHDVDALWLHRARWIHNNSVDNRILPCSTALSGTILQHCVVDISSVRTLGLFLAHYVHSCRDQSHHSRCICLLSRLQSRMNILGKHASTVYSYSLHALPALQLRTAILRLGGTVSRAISLSGDDAVFVAAGLGDVAAVTAMISSRQATSNITVSNRSSLLYKSPVSSGHGLLHCAVCSDDADCVTALLALGCTADYSSSPLSFACTLGSLSTVQVLCDGGVSLVKDMPLAHCRTADVALYLLQRGVPVSSKNSSSALHKAAELGNAAAVRVISHKISVNIRDVMGRTALHYALLHGHVETARILLDLHADTEVLDNDNNSATSLGISAGHVEAVTMMLQRGANIARASLVTAARSADHRLLMALLTHGCNTNVTDSAGDTLLHIVCRHGDDEIMQCMISHGANVNAKNMARDSCLHVACLYNNTAAVVALLHAGANVNACNNKLMKPMQLTKSQDIIKLLL